MSISRGDLVRVKRPESYWYNEIGKVASVDTSGTVSYTHLRAHETQ